MRILALVSDGFGGFGGIAKFNRDLLSALCNYVQCDEVVVLPRLISDETGNLPPKLTHVTNAAGSKGRFIVRLMVLLTRDTDFDLILCGHIHLLPPAFVASLRTRAPVMLVIHGVEAWRPTDRLFTNYFAKRIDTFVAVSEYTRRKFLDWTKPGASEGFILPNSVDLSHFRPGPKNPQLIRRYHLEGKKVLFTLARLDSSQRYKGVDEVMQVLPHLSRQVPSIRHLVGGYGSDLPRLKQKAKTLGLTDIVTFIGPIAEREKVDHFRLADVFVMPSRGEGFGIVFLEAIACGIPVIAGSIGGSREALQEGKLGRLVNPDDPQEIEAAILSALASPSRGVLPGIADFSCTLFEKRVHLIIEKIMSSLSTKVKRAHSSRNVIL